MAIYPPLYQYFYLYPYFLTLYAITVKLESIKYYFVASLLSGHRLALSINISY